MLALALALIPPILQDQAQKPIPADLADQVRRAEDIGKAIFESDQAAWHGSDALAEAKGPLEKLGLGGFLTVREQDKGWSVLFLTRAEPVRVAQRVSVGPSESTPKVLDTPEPLPLSKADAALWAARQLALESGGPYEQPINPVVLRGSDFGESGILVYLLGGTQKPDVAVLGRHVRVRVSDDGTKVTEVLPLVKGVIESPTKSPDGKQVVGLMATQLVTDFPTEVQVFAQLNAGLPLYVATRRGVWKLEQGKIAYMGERPPAKATLRLALRERASGEQRDGYLMLWRTGIPAENGWTAGDEYVGQYQLPKEGLEIPDLVPGTYRAASDAHAVSAGDLPAFELKSPRGEVTLAIESPQEREVWVEVFDKQGQTFETAEFTPGSRSGSLRAPAWVKLRKQIAEDGSESGIGMVGGFQSSRADHGGGKLRRGAHGFSLGREREDGGLYETVRSISLRVPEHGTVGGTLRFAGHEELRYRALLIEKGDFEGLFTMADGSELNLAWLHLQTPLEPDVLPRPAEWWLDVPVQVAVQAPGCKRLELEFRLREGLPKPRTLEKKP